MKLAKLVIVKGTKKECENYFKMISANKDVEMYDVEYAYITEPHKNFDNNGNPIITVQKLEEVDW